MMRSVLKWVFLKGPAGLYVAGEESNGSVPWPFLAAAAVVAGGSAMVGATVGALLGYGVADATGTGLLVGIFIVLAWTVYAAFALIFLWFRGLSPSSVLGERSSVDGDTEVLSGRHAEPVAWRTKGGRLIPGRAVAFFALMIVFGAWEWMSSERALNFIEAENRVETTGQVVEFRDPAFWDRGPGKILVTFDVGEPVKAEVSGETGEHDFDVGSTVPIEYDRSDPARAQITWTKEERVSDASFGKWFTAIAAALTALCAAGWAIGRKAVG